MSALRCWCRGGAAWGCSRGICPDYPRSIMSCLSELTSPVTAAAAAVLLLLQVYQDLDFSLLEMNPFTLDAAGKPFPLDMRGELDDTAAYRRWGRVGWVVGGRG